MNKSKLISLKRINKDIQEITKNPIEGIGIIQYENDFMKYIINIQLMNGIYKGFCLQLLLTFSETYPTNPPKILLFPGQNFDQNFHHHVFNDFNGFYKFCFDLLENDFMKTDEEHTGWNPSYTISSLLIQVQNFLCEPDLHTLPSQEKIQNFISNMKNYKREFIDCNGNVIIHTWDSPYPKMFFNEEKKINEKEDVKDLDKENNKNKEINEEEQKRIKEEEMKKKEELRLNEIKENLTCFMLKLNYIDDPEILLGYPIVQSKGLGRVFRIELFPIPELLTYDGFMAQIGKKDEKLDFYFDISFKSANNEFYNYWVPIYIDKNHFEKNKQTILNSFSIIKYGAIGLKEYDFRVEDIFEVVPIILNKMIIIGIFTKKSSLSEAFIKCYFQYILLFKKLTEIYKKEFNEYVNKIIKQIENNYYHINKNIIPDIGNFLVLLLFSDIPINNKIWNSLFEDFVIRQMYWIFHGPDNEQNIKNYLFECIIPSDINIYIDKIIKEERKIENLEPFLNLCNIYKIEDELINIFKNDKKIISLITDKNNIFSLFEDKNNIKISNNFRTKFNEYLKKCTNDSRDEISTILKEKFTYYDLIKILPEQTLDFINFNKFDYEKKNVDKILKLVDIKYQNDLLNKFFDCQKGNKLLIISYLARKKIKTKGFLEELERNYGVLLNVSDFIKEIQINLKEINSYKKLFEFVNCDLIKKLSEFDFIIKTYDLAKKKGYIKTFFESNKSKFIRNINKDDDDDIENRENKF